MDIHVTLGLILVMSLGVHGIDEQIKTGAVPITSCQDDVSTCTPTVPQDIRTNVTNSAFLLLQLNCNFKKYSTANVWLLVATKQESEKLNDSNYSTPVPYSSFVNGLNNYYHTLLVSAEKYPCSNNSSDPITVIQVGSGSCQTVDINQFCNGKLRNTETYRVRFVLLDSTGLVAKTNWSAEISLMKDINFQGINKWPSGRSGGMITLTVILSVLLAILLVFLFAALAIGSRDICWKRTMDNEKRMSQMDFMTHSTYRSHHDHMYLVS